MFPPNFLSEGINDCCSRVCRWLHPAEQGRASGRPARPEVADARLFVHRRFSALAHQGSGVRNEECLRKAMFVFLCLEPLQSFLCSLGILMAERPQSRIVLDSEMDIWGCNLVSFHEHAGKCSAFNFDFNSLRPRWASFLLFPCTKNRDIQSQSLNELRVRMPLTTLPVHLPSLQPSSTSAARPASETSADAPLDHTANGN